jgi:hypothetical protein
MMAEVTEAMLREAHARSGVGLPFEEAMASATGLGKALRVLARQRVQPRRRRG